MNNSPVCVDASLVVHLVVGGAQETKVATLWQTWLDTLHPLIAPTLLYYEVSNAIHRYVVHNYLLPEAADEALHAALSLNVALYGESNLHRRALELARQHSLPAVYDAHYLALAEHLEAEFWTTDRRLVQAVQADLSWVHLVG